MTATQPVLCEAVVWRKDTYRRTGRGPTGFEMHYQQSRCTRRAQEDGLCWQHLAMKRPGWFPLRVKRS